jgi:hypothetical protein
LKLLEVSWVNSLRETLPFQSRKLRSLLLTLIINQESRSKSSKERDQWLPTIISWVSSILTVSPLLQEEFHKLKFLSILMPMVFLLSLLKTRELVKLPTLLSLTRREDYLRKKLTDLSKRLRNIKRLMSRESNKLSLRITSSNTSIRSRLWSRMRESRIKLTTRKDSRLTINVMNYLSGYMLTRMLLRMSMKRRDKS